MVLWVLACCYSFSKVAYATGEEVKLTSPNHTTVYDDGYAEVPLQFVFPFYDKEFETSYMFTNGVVGFRNPTDNQVESHWCCEGRDLATMAENEQEISRYGYAIAPLWTDLIDLETGNSGLFAEGDTLQQTYRWKNLAEFYDATRLNTFELQIKSDGTYIVDYVSVNIQDHAVTTGASGDLSQGVYEGTQQQYYPSGIVGIPPSYGKEAVKVSIPSFDDSLCAANALYDPQCSGYSEAYAQQLFEQECMYNPQYDPTCNGYVDMEEREVVQVRELVEDGSSAGSIEEAIEQPNIVTDFANTSGYEIEGMPRASAPPFEMPTVFEPEVFEQEPPEVVNEMQQMEQELEREIVSNEPRELEQSEVPEREVAEEPVEEIVEREQEPEPREEQEQEEVVEPEPREELREQPVEEQSDTEQKQPTQKAIVNKPTTTPKATKKQALTKNEKLKVLVSKKAIALTKQVENATTLEQQVQVQQQMLALISFVPDFNYAEGKVKDLETFYPLEENIDSSFSRWFRTDPNFEVLEDSQYPQRNTQWQR